MGRLGGVLGEELNDVLGRTKFVFSSLGQDEELLGRRIYMVEVSAGG